MARWIAAALLLISSPPQMPFREAQPPLPPGNRIVAQDGDTIVVEGSARVRVVRRMEAHVRTVFNAAERWVVVLADHAGPGAPDGLVDSTHSYYGIRGEWPLGDRWEGPATIEEYTGVGPSAGPRGYGLSTPHGLIQFLGPPMLEPFREADAIAVVSFEGGGGGVASNTTFEQAEQQTVAQVRRNAAQRNTATGRSLGGASPPGGLATSLTMSAGPAFDAVRVGGQIAPPTKVHDVAPAYPEEAHRAGIRGVVILEVVIDVEGRVSEARVLRSLPMLDGAAVAAVRQWRYTPTVVEGRAVPVVMTVSVPFP